MALSIEEMAALELEALRGTSAPTYAVNTDPSPPVLSGRMAAPDASRDYTPLVRHQRGFAGETAEVIPTAMEDRWYGAAQPSYAGAPTSTPAGITPGQQYEQLAAAASAPTPEGPLAAQYLDLASQFGATPQAAPPVAAPAPKRVGGMRRPRVGDPGEFLAAMERETDSKKQAGMRKAFDAWKATPIGLDWQIGKRQHAGEAERGALDIQAAEGQAEQAQLTQLDIQNQAAADEERAAELAERRVDYEQEYARREGDYERLQIEVGNMEVDPERYWERKGTGARIGSAIAVALGAMGSALAKVPNFALDIVNKSISDDLDAQKANIGNKRAQLTGQGKLLAMMRDKFDDDATADAAALAISTRAAANRARARAAGQLSKEAKAGGEKLASELEQQADVFDKQVAQANAIAAQQAAQGRGRGRAPAQAKKADLARYVGLDIKNPDGTTTRVQGLAGDATRARQLQKGLEGMNRFQAGINRMKQLTAETGFATPLTDRKLVARIEAAQGDVIAALGEARQSGIIQEGEFERLSKSIPDASDWFQRKDTAMAALSELQGIASQNMSSAVDAASLTPATKISGAGPGGKPVEVIVFGTPQAQQQTPLDVQPVGAP